MYGKAFHEWQIAQRLIEEIEAQEPEVREIVRKRYERDRQQELLLRSHLSPSPSMAEQMQRQYGQNLGYSHHGFPFLGGIFGG